MVAAPGPRPATRWFTVPLLGLALVLGSFLVVLGVAPATATPARAAAPAVTARVASGPGTTARVATGTGGSAASRLGSGRKPGHPTRAERRRSARLKAKRQRAAKRKAARKAARKARQRARAARKAAQKRAAAAKRAAKRRAAAARRAAARLRAKWARVDPRNPRTWYRTAPSNVAPWDGPRFNNPYGSTSQRRALVDKVINAINASPGYVTRNPVARRTMRCPVDPRLAPSEIKIAVYSIADMRFARAIVAARRRCVSVQVLMNSHLTVKTSRSWRMIINTLGRKGTTYRRRASFAHRCSNGCLGTAVMHSKFFLFSRAGSARDVVMTGSSNIARNATKIQFNDLYTVTGNAEMYSQYRRVFEAMVPDRTERRSAPPRVFTAGPYTSTFYPYFRADARTDATMKDLRSIRCRGATGGAGIGGRTVVYIAMHSWFGVRGGYLAGRVRRMYDRGCYVRILYSFMSARIHGQLTWGTGRRMTARRVLFPGPRGVVANKYSHMKMYAVSGRVGGNRSAWVVWTGSNNFTDKGPRADEVTLRIPIKSVYDTYVRHWKYMKKRRSSPVWALYEEPVGGGRAPAPRI